MAFDLNLIAQSAIAVASSISGIRGGSAWDVDTIPVTPYVVAGMSRADVTPGDRTVVRGEIPIRLYVERMADSARDTNTVNSYVNTFITTFALDQDLGGHVTDATITAWDADRFYQVGGALYAAVDFTLSFFVDTHVPQALRTVLP